MFETIKVTVYLSTYNQQDYVREALDSILMQKTNFQFEVLVADDCSTDRTQKIILEYQQKNPQIIRTYFTPVNIGGCKKLTNCIDMGLFRGEYLAFLEGDDYWLCEDRLQILVDFLDAHPEYSRVSHKRKVIDENGTDRGFDISDNVLEKTFTIVDFLEGRQYSDFGSVFRNYFREAGSKYHPLLQASRNVCDFQDMFITQDFGPVYVMDKCLGVYRSRSVAGGTNYNSITTQSARCRENIRLAKAVETFYNGKYDLTPMVLRNQKRLLFEAVAANDAQAFCDARNYITPEIIRNYIPELIYLALRGGRKSEIIFMKEQLLPEERRGTFTAVLMYALQRVNRKISGAKPEDKKRGTICVRGQGEAK